MKKMANENRLIDALVHTEDDLISRRALIAEYDRVHIGEPGGARKLIEDAPTVDAVEVVHGRWIYHLDDLFPIESTQECSVCHEHELCTLFNESYCPNCGAKMDGDKHE